MSEIDNLDSLSNADIRQKCREYGLPNVPVTDTSRKLLIRKLRLSMGGAVGGDGKNSPLASKSEKQQRRETIDGAVSLPVSKATLDAEKAIRAGNRRTIAAAIAETNNNSEPSITQSQPLPTTRTQSRRRSTSTPKVATGPPPRVIQEENQEYPTVVLESDEDEDNDLLEAAKRAEKVEKPQEPKEPQRQTKIPVMKTANEKEKEKETVRTQLTISKTTVSSSSLVGEPAPQLSKSNLYSFNLQGASASSSVDPPERRSYALPSLRPTMDFSSRYAEYLKPAYASSPAASTSAAYMRSSYAPAPSNLVSGSYANNEFSDDAANNQDDDDEYHGQETGNKTRYVSKFMRDLERSRHGSGVRSPPGAGGSNAYQRYESGVTARPSSRSGRRMSKPQTQWPNVKGYLILCLGFALAAFLLWFFWK